METGLFNYKRFERWRLAEENSKEWRAWLTSLAERWRDIKRR